MDYSISQKVIDILKEHTQDFGVTFNVPEGFPQKFLNRGKLSLQWEISFRLKVGLCIDSWGVYVQISGGEVSPKEAMQLARVLLRVSELAVMIDEVHLKDLPNE